MKLYSTLIDLLDEARGKDREIRFIDGENKETTLRFGDLWDRATALLGSLQARGMQPGDELVIFSTSNQSFVIAYWAAMLGGIVPVPVAPARARYVVHRTRPAGTLARVFEITRDGGGQCDPRVTHCSDE